MLSLDCNQHPRNDLYGDVYKSRFGAVEEAHHVFVQGAGLPERFAQNKSCTIVELGFGLGVNFLATQRAWRNTPSPRSRLHFVSIEKHPLDAHQIKVAHAALGLDDEDARALRAVWPTPTPGMHRLDFDDGSVTLMVAHGDLHDILPKLRLRADAIFLDGFSPRCNPDMWSLRAMKALGRLASNDARLATYSSSRLVRDNLAASGFEVTLKPGFGAKHRRIEARHAPRWTAPSSTQPIAQAPERRVIIVGAGLAGCAIAERLARSGWQVTLLERSSSIGGQAATQPAIADHLHLSPDDNPTARLTRAALLLDRDSQWPAMQHVGRLELAANAQQALTKQACAEKLAFPEQLLRYVDSQEANRLTGLTVGRAGLWLPACRHVDPLQLCRQWLDRAAALVRLQTGVQVAGIEHDGQRWIAFDASRQILDSAPVMILANAGDAARLGGMAPGDLRRVRGQSTWLSDAALGRLRCVLGGPAYACPLPDSGLLIGATFDDDDNTSANQESDLSNLRRFARMLDADREGEALDSAEQVEALARQLLAQSRTAGVGFRVTTRDRLPMIGRVPDSDQIRARAADLARNAKLPLPMRRGLFGAFAFGSRGLLWSRLAAETIAAMLQDEPLPLEADLLDAIDPARFMRRALRRSHVVASKF